MPEFTIIMPIYNREEYLGRSIGSVINQTFDDWELIVVDDGSTDTSFDICQIYAKSDSRIRPFRQENAGPGSARNRGIDMATGKYILFLDSDDWYEHNCLRICADVIDKYEPDIVTFFMKEHYCDKTLTNKRALIFKGISEEEMSIYLMSRDISVGTRAVKRRIFTHNDIRFPSWPVAEDICVNLLAYALADSIIQIPFAFYNYDRNVVNNSESFRGDAGEFAFSIPGLLKSEFKSRGLYKEMQYGIFKAFLTDMKYFVNISPNCEERERRKQAFLSAIGDDNPKMCKFATSRFLVFGSYTLRSAVQSVMLDAKEIEHFQFQSIVSAMNTNGKKIVLVGDNEYRKAMIERQLSCQFVKTIENREFDYFVFDFLEERYDLMRLTDNWYTVSEAFEESVVDAYTKEGRRFGRFGEDINAIFYNRCLDFIGLVLSNFDPDRVILVENYLMERKGEYGPTKYFDSITDIRAVNKLLNKYYRFIESRAKGIRVIKPFEKYVGFSDLHYKHGCEPSHTVEAWESIIGDTIMSVEIE